MAKFDIVTASKKYANSVMESGEKIVGVISIGNPRSTAPVSVRGTRKPVLRLMFNDIDDRVLQVSNVKGFKVPSKNDVMSIIQFGQRIIKKAESKGGIILCHCDCGMSRSTACAVILRSIYHGKDKEGIVIKQVEMENPSAMPNLRMIRIADKIMERNGKLLRATMTLHP